MKQLCLALNLSLALLLSSFVQADNFVIGSPQETEGAFAAELDNVIKMYESLGHTAVVKSLPGARSIAMSNSGELDAEMIRIATITQQAPNLVPIKVPLGQVKVTFFGKEGSPYKVQADLTGLTLAAPRGIALAKAIAEKFSMKLQEAPNLAAAAKMVGNGRADLFVFTEGGGMQAIKAAGMEGTVTIVGEPYATIPLFHFLNKKHEALVPEFEAALKAIIGQ